MRSWVLIANIVLILTGTVQSAEETPSLFAGDVYTSIVTLLIFSLLLLVLRKYAWKPMMEAINKRESQIRDAISEAQREKQHADELLEEYKQLLQAAELEAEELIKETQLKAKKMQEEILEHARGQAKEIIEQAGKRIEEAETEAVRRIYDSSVDIGVEIAAKILQREVNAEDHRILIQQGLDELKVK